MNGEPVARRRATQPDRDKINAIGVVIPAHNEEARIGGCLEAVTAAAAHLGDHGHPDIAVSIVVVLDSCVDRSAEIARRHLGVETIAAGLNNVGAARWLGTRTLLPRTPAQVRHIWLANTDADSVVPQGWLTDALEQADRGADLILGTVEPDSASTPRLRQAWKRRHCLEDGHQHVHGANFGIRGSTYLELGGWPHRRSGEDASLADAAEANGTVRILRSGGVPVLTSSRLTGRAPLGFARYLQLLTDEIDQPSQTPATLSG